MTFYDNIELTTEEIEAALLEGRKKKYFHEKNKDYWVTQEKTKQGRPLPGSQDQTHPVKDQSTLAAPHQNV